MILAGSHLKPAPGMNPPIKSAIRARLLAFTFASTVAVGVNARASQLDGGTFNPVIDETKAVTLFAFDNVSIPFTRSLKLEMNAPVKYAGNPVLGRGKPGETDSWAIHF